ncbi:MAG TPA: hypothetical protein PKM48_13510, partial [Parvularculaceae bacterium]|nr:hypothetical protein [Parvularculaceae bacterium]
MSEHVAEISWKRETESFAYDHYNRGHEWKFDAGVTVTSVACPRLAPAIQAGTDWGEEMIEMIREYTEPLRRAD